jgi:hypothetical protein
MKRDYFADRGMVLANNIKSNIMKTGSEEVNRKDKDRIQ